MTTNHIAQLAEWWEGAAQVAPMRGDLIIEDVTDEDGPDYRIRNWPGDMREKLSYVRVLSPKPKPAWHDAVAVIARVDDGSQTPDTSRVALLRDVNEPGQWVRGYCDNVYSDELFDVTPLIEAKVTDEMVKRGAQASTPAGVRYLRPHEVREVLTAALGLDPA